MHTTLTTHHEDLAVAARVGARHLTPDSEEWPARMLTGPADSPTAAATGLWVRGTGNLRSLLQHSVAVIGSRASTAYGEHVASELAHGLARENWTVVSGGAFGIDAAAHRGALAAEGPTVVFLPCGIDRAYPAAHTALFDRILESGGLLVSEYPPGSSPLRYRFLERNRLTVGLTRGTVVVESAARSGTFQAARLAGELGRSLMAVPGPVTSAMSVGNHELLRAHATLVTSAADVLREVTR